MSVIMRNISGGGSGSSSSKGFPPGDVNIISINSGVKSCKIKFSDPDNSIYNNTTLSIWSSTIIVRKEGSAPTSIKDGIVVLTNTTKNKYKDNYFVDNNVVVGKTYYYRFYTMSTDKVYNDSTSMIRSCLIREFDPILKNNTWAQISEAAESGVASSLWNIGDEINISISQQKASVDSCGRDISAQTVTLQIWDFNHFDKSDGSGKAGICFGSKDLMGSARWSTYSDEVYNNWSNSFIKEKFCPYIFKSLPEGITKYIKKVNTYAAKGSRATSNGALSVDDVFIPGYTELYGNSSSGVTDIFNTEKKQKAFPIFTDDNSRIKKYNNTDSIYWTRSRAPANDTYIGVDTTGYHYISSGGSSDYLGICFCFNV